MLLHGDELGRTQSGNNNVYAQDNELAWVDWARADDFTDLTAFVERLGVLRHAHPIFQRRRHFQGKGMQADEIGDIGWFTPGGGVHRGETVRAAAVRELFEETGFAFTEAGLGPVVATSSSLWLAKGEGKLFLGHHSFFFLRVPSAMLTRVICVVATRAM